MRARRVAWTWEGAVGGGVLDKKKDKGGRVERSMAMPTGQDEASAGFNNGRTSRPGPAAPPSQARGACQFAEGAAKRDNARGHTKVVHTEGWAGNASKFECVRHAFARYPEDGRGVLEAVGGGPPGPGHVLERSHARIHLAVHPIETG